MTFAKHCWLPFSSSSITASSFPIGKMHETLWRVRVGFANHKRFYLYKNFFFLSWTGLTVDQIQNLLVDPGAFITELRSWAAGKGIDIEETYLQVRKALRSDFWSFFIYFQNIFSAPFFRALCLPSWTRRTSRPRNCWQCWRIPELLSVILISSVKSLRPETWQWNKYRYYV